MYIPRLKKGKSLSKLPNQVKTCNENQRKLKKIMPNTVKLRDFDHKELKIIEVPKKNNFPYIGYFSSRKGINENSDEKQKALPITLKSKQNKAHDKNKATRIKCKPILNNSIGMKIISILRNSQLPDILTKNTKDERAEKSESAEINFSVLTTPQSQQVRTPSISKLRVSHKLKAKSKSEINSLIKYPNFTHDMELKNKLSDPYHINNIMKNPHFTPFGSLLDCNEEVINKELNFDFGGNKVASLRKKIYEQRIKTGMAMKIC